MNTRQAYEQAARMLAGMCQATHSALLCGSPSPRQQRLFDWMLSPTLGDMVFVDAAGSESDAAKTVGRWVATWTYLPLDEEPEDLPYAERAAIQVWQIELLDGSLYSWSDVRLLRVPADRSEWQRAERGRPAFVLVD